MPREVWVVERRCADGWHPQAAFEREDRAMVHRGILHANDPKSDYRVMPYAPRPRVGYGEGREM